MNHSFQFLFDMGFIGVVGERAYAPKKGLGSMPRNDHQNVQARVQKPTYLSVRALLNH